jgi:hypothetical protein
MAKIGPSQLFALFIDVLEICADTCTVANSWGTPEKISSWLDARGADLLTDERMLANTHAYGAAVPPLQTCSANPLAQELEWGSRLEKILIEQFNFRPCRPISSHEGNHYVISQQVI